MSGLVVRVVRDVTEFDPIAWDGLLGPDDVQQSHAFARLCQESRVESAEFWHLIPEQGGEVCATASLCRMSVRLDTLSADLPRGLIGTVRRVWPSFLTVPVLFCGPPVSFGQPLLTI